MVRSGLGIMSCRGQEDRLNPSAPARPYAVDIRNAAALAHDRIVEPSYKSLTSPETPGLRGPCGRSGLQAKLARDAARKDKDNDRVLEAREQDRHAAALLLTRVRTQMMEAYRPLAAARFAADYTMLWMARELDFEWIQLTAYDSCFMRPSKRLYPHLEVLTYDYAPEFGAHALEAQGATMWHKWSPDDMQVRYGAPSGLARL